jgi:hypothetical protein
VSIVFNIEALSRAVILIDIKESSGVLQPPSGLGEPWRAQMAAKARHYFGQILLF